MAITITKQKRRKKIMLSVGFTIAAIALAVIIYLVFLKPVLFGQKNLPPVTSVLSEELIKLEIKWEILEDKRLQTLEDFSDASSLAIEKSGRENPFMPY